MIARTDPWLAAGTGAHPIPWAFARLAGLSEYLDQQVVVAGVPRGDDWIAAAALAQDGARLDRLLARAGARHGTDDRRVQASLLFADFAGRLAATAIGCFLVAGRVPDLDADPLFVRVAACGAFDGVALGPGRFATLADDPAAAHPDARLLPDIESLRAALAATLTGAAVHGVAAALAERTPYGRTPLTVALADRIAGMTVYLLGLLGRSGESEREVRALLGAAGFSGRAARAGTITLDHAGLTQTYARRASCCLAFRLAAGEHCAVCPIQTPAAIERRLRALIAGGADA